MDSQKTYIAIDLKSFYASVECVARGLDPLTTNLLVADVSKTEKTICLAVTPSLKAHGISGRARLFEAVQQVKMANAKRKSMLEDTKINSPVMQSKDNPNFYLKHGFDKAYTDYGCPYVQENCDMELQSDNIIIYGHHMNDGSMFAGLMKFKDKNFWEKHKTISFDTLTDRQTYEVIAVFKTVVYTDSPESFKYYQFVNAENAEDFTAYVEKCKELSLYDTGVTAEYGDKLLTLSTCEYSRTNGRLVVVAKLINE